MPAAQRGAARRRWCKRTSAASAAPRRPSRMASARPLRTARPRSLACLRQAPSRSPAALARMPRPGARTAHVTSEARQARPLLRLRRGRARHRLPCAAPAEMRPGAEARARAPGATAVPRLRRPAGPRSARGARAAPGPQPSQPRQRMSQRLHPLALLGACRPPSPCRPPAPRPPRTVSTRRAMPAAPRRPRVMPRARARGLPQVSRARAHGFAAVRRGGRGWGALHPLRIAPPRLRRGPAACGGPALAALARPPKRSGGRAWVQNARWRPQQAGCAGAPQAGGPSHPAARCAGRWCHRRPVLPPGLPHRPRPRKGAPRRLRRLHPCAPVAGAALHGVAAVAAHAQQGRAPPTG